MGRALRLRQLVMQRRMQNYAAFCVHYRCAAKEVARLDANPKLASAFVSRSAFERWLAGDIKRMPRATTCRVLEHLFGEPADALFGPPIPDDADTAGPGDGPPHLAAMESFRLADRQLGGGHVYRSVLHYLQVEISPSLFGVDAGRNTSNEEAFRFAAVLTEMAGWMAHDTGLDVMARRHFAGALNLGRAVVNASLVSNIKAGMSHLALQTGQVDDAVDLARSGLEELNSAAPVPVLSARLHAMEARACTTR